MIKQVLIKISMRSRLLSFAGTPSFTAPSSFPPSTEVTSSISAGMWCGAHLISHKPRRTDTQADRTENTNMGGKDLKVWFCMTQLRCYWGSWDNCIIIVSPHGMQNTVYPRNCFITLWLTAPSTGQFCDKGTLIWFWGLFHFRSWGGGGMEKKGLELKSCPWWEPICNNMLHFWSNLNPNPSITSHILK